MAEVFLFPTRDHFYRARYRVRATDPWRYTAAYRERWRVWDEIECALQQGRRP